MLDEKKRELLTEWLSGIASHNYLSAVEYRYQLTRVVGAVAHHGGAIILGRGAHLNLGQGEALRVLVVAPLEARIATVMRARWDHGAGSTPADPGGRVRSQGVSD